MFKTAGNSYFQPFSIQKFKFPSRFYDECLERFKPEDVGEKVWRAFIEAFNCMPLAAFVGGKVFCAHGGISPWLETLDDINAVSALQ